MSTLTLKTALFPKYLTNCCIYFNYYNNRCLKLITVNAARGYAKKPAGASAKTAKASAPSVSSKPKLQPVTDAKLLTTKLCGGNILKEGEDPILKDKSEYPEWLWSLRLTRSPPPIEEVDQNSWEFWKRVNKLDRKKRSQELALKYKYHKF